MSDDLDLDDDNLDHCDETTMLLQLVDRPGNRGRCYYCPEKRLEGRRVGIYCCCYGYDMEIEKGDGCDGGVCCEDEKDDNRVLSEEGAAEALLTEGRLCCYCSSAFDVVTEEEGVEEDFGKVVHFDYCG